MVEHGIAADCDYSERNRKETAIRFVIDAFNGRVDAILSRSKHDNHGTLEQEIRDAFSLVNQNGEAFRNARILPAYLESRLSELRWAVVAYELKLKEREEQRRIREQIKEEERARKEYERAMKEAQREEDIIKDALEKARREAEAATADQRAELEQQMAELARRLAEAEAKNQRALSMAQQTRKGNVYIISNIGSFGEGVFKIGMTRRLEPMERIYELGDASVPFEFDVHAIIPSDDAPTLEYRLHEAFDDLRINHVNFRKEFFRVPLDRVREFVSKHGIEVSFTMAAEAHEFRESLAISKMSPEDRERYHLANQGAGSG
jgi:flagellar biosynthesis GTPase FlhF